MAWMCCKFRRSCSGCTTEPGRGGGMDGGRKGERRGQWLQIITAIHIHHTCIMCMYTVSYVLTHTSCIDSHWLYNTSLLYVRICNLTIFVDDCELVEVPLAQYNSVVAPGVISHQFILLQPRHACCVEEVAVLTHVQREGLEQEGHVPGKCRWGQSEGGGDTVKDTVLANANNTVTSQTI